MLNSETKKHIDAARQVLVGVAPNPMTQIDQITYALIYKFMDDMDQAAIKAGGEPSFFTADLEPFAWSKLLDTRMGNQERLNLYAAALQKFSEASQLPELFRTIFRSALLPYRSPETLGLFLKEISFFDYSHPEELGNAYEYLLSIMSSQGDAGQFRTPRHIIDFIVSVMDPTKEDHVLDPACGTGGFLVASYNHILSKHGPRNESQGSEKPLTPNERKTLAENFQGFDIDPSMVRIAQVNMYLHQFKNPRIFQYDTLTSEDRWGEKFDLILANPPFMSPKGGIKAHSKFGVSSNRSELLFVDYIIGHLKPNGRAAIIVPEGVLFQTGKAYKDIRRSLVEKGLYAVLSLPGGVFQPYSGVKTSILFVNPQVSARRQDIAFVKVSAHGFDLGVTRREIPESDLPLALEALEVLSEGGSPDASLITFVPKSEIEMDLHFSLSANRYSLSKDFDGGKWDLIPLGDLASSISNGLNCQNNKSDGGLPITRIQTISSGRIDFDLVGYANMHSVNPKYLMQPGDILLSHINSIDHIGKVAIYEEGMGTLVHGMNLLRIQPKREIVQPKYLHYILTSSFFRDKVKSFAKQAVNQASLSIADLKLIKLPVPPLEIQNQIISSLDEITSAIDAANSLVESLKAKTADQLRAIWTE